MGTVVRSSRSMPDPGPPRPGRFTIRVKLGLTLALAASLLGLLSAAIVRDLLSIRTAAERLQEEHEEAFLTRELVDILQEIEGHRRAAELGLRGEDLGERSPEALLRHAHGLLHALRRVEHDDPSDTMHEQTEVDMYRRMSVLLADLESGMEVSSGQIPSSQTASALGTARNLAVTLREEIEEELREAGRELDTRAKGAVRTTALALALGLILMVALFVLVRRDLVLPLANLREGAVRIGAGDFARRIDIASKDEIGALADDFNWMAAQLADARERLEGQIRERTRQFIQAGRLAGLGTLAARVAHEINTPLASIASCAEGLERRLERGEVGAGEQIEYLQTISREAYRAHETTARLLTIARQEPSDREMLEIRDVLQDVCLVLRHELEKDRLDLALEMDEPLPRVRGNGSELKQVFLNLLTNARDVSPAGGMIRIRASAQDGRLIVEVADEGPGVSPEIADRLFEPFFTTKPPGKGTGLGLAVVARILEEHGGTIDLAGRAEGGTTIRVVLPAEGGVEP